MILTICTIIIVPSIAIGIYLLNEENEDDKWHQYRREIKRDVKNESEENILKIAENFNYSSLLNINRFQEGNVLNISDYGTANFIDEIVVNHYWNKIELLKKGNERGDNAMKYYAKVNYMDEVHIKGHRYEGNWSSWNEIQIETNPLINEYDYYFDYPYQLFINNGTNVNVIHTGGMDKPDFVPFEVNISNCYLIQMKLSFGIQTDIAIGRGFDLFQYLYLDQYGELLMFHYHRYDWIS